MDSLTAIENIQTKNVSGLSTRRTGNFRHSEASDRELPENDEHTSGNDLAGAVTPEVVAHSVEFVAWPGKTEELQTVLPESVRSAFAGCASFSGCLVLVSEQEARLVTVITLWTGENRTKQCAEYSKRVQRLLLPHVERWLRTRRLAGSLSTR